MTKPETRDEKIARLDRARERSEMEAAFPSPRKSRKSNPLAAPFDKRNTTKTYGARLAQMKGEIVYLFESAKGSNARAMGMNWGTFMASEAAAYVEGGATPVEMCSIAGTWAPVSPEHLSRIRAGLVK